jgi:signal transduction histidine kinase/CheY-like chemotaxis protein
MHPGFLSERQDGTVCLMRINLFWVAVGLALSASFCSAGEEEISNLTVPAYDRSWQITSFATAGGLANQRVFDIAFEPDGTVWLAAGDGLRRFDGYNWERFGTNAGLPSTFARAVCVTAQGELWVGSDAGAGVFDPQHRKYDARGSTTGLASLNVREIDEDPDGALWFSCDQWPETSPQPGGLTCRQNGRWQTYGRRDGIPMDYVIGYFRDSTGRQFALTPRGWARRQGERWSAPANPGYEAEDCVLHMTEGKDGTLFAQGERLLLVLTNNQWRPCGNRTKLVGATRRGEVVAVEHDESQGLLWFSRWDGQRFVRASASVPCPPGGRFYHLREAPDGALWCVGYGTVVRWAYRAGKWTLYPNLPAPVGADSRRRFWFAGESNIVVYEEGHYRFLPPGRFYALNWEGAAVILRADRNELVVTDPANPAASSRVSTSFEKIGGVRPDEGGAFWIFGQDKNDAGLVAHVSRGKTTLISPPEFRDRPLYAATPDPRNGLWVVAYQKNNMTYGLALVTDEGAQWQTLAPAPPPLMYPTFAVGAGRYWLHGYSGLYERSPAATGTWQQVTAFPDNGFSSSVARSDEVLFLFSGGRSGRSGCALFVPDRWNTVYGDFFRAAPGLDGKTIYLCARSGLFIRREPGTLDFEHLPTPGNAFINSVFADEAGALWLGTSEGVLHYQPSHTPPVATVNAALTEVNAGTKLPVTFGGLQRFDLDNPAGSFRYSWRVDSNPWSRFGPWPGQSLEIPRLPPGLHQLEVRVRDADGNVNPSPAALKFTVLPEPLQKRPWFMPAAWSLAALVAWLCWLGVARTRQIARSNAALRQEIAIRRRTEAELQQAREQLERRVAERTAELTRANESLNRAIAEQRQAEESRRQLEEQLHLSQKMEAIGTLAGGIAHDFNNILAIIFPCCHLALENARGRLKLQGYLREVLKAAERAKKLVRQIMVFSRQQRQERRTLDLQPIVKEALRMLRSLLPSTIEIVQRLEPAPPALVDPTQIHQVIMNLCVNAEHAMRGHPGRLEVELAGVEVDAAFAGRNASLSPGRYVRLCVRDNGCGMPPKVLNRIFDPFFTTKEPGQGTGLGLTVVHGIVKNHGGAILVQSEPGMGTEFQIFLPARTDQVSAPAKGAQLASPGHGEHILLVDDEASIIAALGELLSRVGYKVTSRTDPRTALKELTMHPADFDLLFTDLTMPGMNGVELAKKIFEIRPDLPVVITTGFGGESVDETTKQANIRKVVEKPLHLAHITRIVSETLQAARRC